MNSGLKSVVSGLLIVLVAGVFLTSCGKSEQAQVKSTGAENTTSSTASIPATGDARTYIEAADKHFTVGEFVPAIENLEKAKSLEPDNADIYLKLGHIYPAIGKHEESIKSYEKAVELQPDNFDAYVYLANAYRMAKKIDLSVKTFEKAKELAKTQKPELVEKIDLTIKKIQQ